MLKTFITPQISSFFIYLLFYISGIIIAHSLFSITLSLHALIIAIINFSIITISLLFIKRSYFFLATCLLIGIIRTTVTLRTYVIYKPPHFYSFEIMDVFKTGNSLWPFGTLLKQSYNNTYHQVLLYTQKEPSYAMGDKGTTDLVFKKSSYNEFCRHLLKENIIATTFTWSFNPYIVSTSTFSAHSFLHKIRSNLLTSITHKCSYITAGLFTSLCLGNKKVLKRELKQIKLYFRSWGITHHLARSGLHLIIILFMWYILLSFIPLSYGSKTIIISCIAFLFSLLSFEGISFTRSLFIFFLTQFLCYKNYQIHKTYLLALAAFTFLLYNPFLVFALDFQLSFFITFLLCLLSLINRQKRIAYCKLLIIDYKKF